MSSVDVREVLADGMRAASVRRLRRVLAAIEGPCAAAGLAATLEPAATRPASGAGEGDQTLDETGLDEDGWGASPRPAIVVGLTANGTAAQVSCDKRGGELAVVGVSRLASPAAAAALARAVRQGASPHCRTRSPASCARRWRASCARRCARRGSRRTRAERGVPRSARRRLARRRLAAGGGGARGALRRRAVCGRLRASRRDRRRGRRASARRVPGARPRVPRQPGCDARRGDVGASPPPARFWAATAARRTCRGVCV